MKVGDRVEILDCIYESLDVGKGNFGRITKISSPTDIDAVFMVKLDLTDEDWGYLAKELKVIS